MCPLLDAVRLDVELVVGPPREYVDALRSPGNRSRIADHGARQPPVPHVVDGRLVGLGGPVQLAIPDLLPRLGPGRFLLGAGRLDVFAAGDTAPPHRLHHKWYSGGWSAWENLRAGPHAPRATRSNGIETCSPPVSSGGVRAKR